MGVAFGIKKTFNGFGPVYEKFMLNTQGPRKDERGPAPHGRNISYKNCQVKK